MTRTADKNMTTSDLQAEADALEQYGDTDAYRKLMERMAEREQAAK